MLCRLTAARHPPPSIFHPFLEMRPFPAHPPLPTAAGTTALNVECFWCHNTLATVIHCWLFPVIL
jgi:hypothetical protein